MNCKQLQKIGANYPKIPITICYREETFDPLTCLQTLADTQSACFLFTGQPKENEDGYSFIGLNPQASFVYQEGYLNHSEQKQALKPQLEAVLQANRIPKIPGLPPFVGGLAGYFGYDYARFANSTLPQKVPNPYDLKDADLLLVQQVIAFNHRTKIVTLSKIVATSELSSVYEETIQELMLLKKRLQVFSADSSTALDFTITQPLSLQDSETVFAEKVQITKDHIQDGDIFQLILSNPQHGKMQGSLLAVAKNLFVSSPTPYQFYFKHDHFETVGASPETLITKKGLHLFTYPLAGTRRRGRTQKEDQRFAQELTTSPKELAEHNMLIDLGRNDLGRISQFGSVHVTKERALLKFSNVMHLGSTVESQVDAQASALDIIEALMPAGTLSGAPKVSAMQIIHDLEQRKRGLYGGCLGYIDFSGDLDFCIGIRLAYRQNEDLVVHSGAGIVADSVPHQEFQEFNNKARSVVDALQKTSGVGQ